MIRMIKFKCKSLQSMQSQTRYKPVTSFSRRPCANQIISYIVVAVENISFWALVQNNYTNESMRITMTVLFSISTFLLVLVTLVASGSDPSDPVMIGYKNGNSSVITQIGSPCLFCEHCESYVLATSRHCKICDRCVQKFDHHCIWINNCIGRSNYCLFMVMIVSVFANMAIYLISVALLWTQKRWKQYIASMVANWFVSTAILVLDLLVLALILLHLFLIYNGLTTFDYIMSRRNAQISPIQLQTNTHLSQPNEQPQFTQDVEPEIKRDSQSHSQQYEQNENNPGTQNQCPRPPLSAFNNIQNQQKSDFQSLDHMKSTHNKLRLEKQTQKLMISSNNKSALKQEFYVQNFNNFYKQHPGLKLLVGPSIIVKPKRSQSVKLTRRRNSLKSNQSRYTDGVHIDQIAVASENADSDTIKEEEKI